MSIVTRVVWNEGSLGEDEKSALVTQLASYISANKTDGVKTMVRVTESTYAIERNWTDNTAANEWLEYVNTFSPVSATIKS